MKRFNFSLQKILDYKERIKKNEENILGKLRASHLRLCTERDELISKRREYAKTFESRCETGILASEAMVYKSYISQLNQQIKDLGRRISLLEKEIDLQIKRVIRADKEKTSLEKLRDKYFEEYCSQQRKEEEKLIGEFVSNTSTSRTGSESLLI